MLLYVLQGLIDYGETDLLGVYSTRELAESALASYKAKVKYQGYDDFNIAEIELDAPPAT